MSRDRRQPPGDGSARLIFSNRRNMSYDDLRCYLSDIRGSEATLDRMNWRFVDPANVESHTHEARRGLQIADVFATAFAAAVEPNHYGDTEDRYAKILMPLLYRGPERLLGLGLKLWPSEAIELIRDDAPWLIQ